MPERFIITNGTVLLPEGLKQTDLELRDGVISQINGSISPDESSHVVNAKGEYVLPGFIDIHTNGIAGFDLTNGMYDLKSKSFRFNQEAYMEGLDHALKRYAEKGVTRAILTSVASPIEELKQAFGFVSAYKKKVSESAWKEVLGGLYVEGTFMKLAEYSGAHNPEYFKEPSERLFDELQDAANGIIKIVNIVPEWGDSALRLIEYLSSQGIVCAAGHTGASALQYNRAIKSGTRLVVHFLNGPTGSSTKPFGGGGAVESVLRASNMFVEIIADGYHVDKSYVLDTIGRKGFDKVVIVTDGMFAIGLDGIETFRIFDVDGKVSSNREYVEVASKINTLFGSLLTTDVAFSNLLNWLTVPVDGVWRDMHQPLELEQAFVVASAMCSKNPAKALGIFEPTLLEHNADLGHYSGSIETGKCADIVIAKLERIDGKFKLNIDKVFVKGKAI